MNRNFENKLLKENIYYFLQNQEKNEKDLLNEINFNNIKQYIKKNILIFGLVGIAATVAKSVYEISPNTVRSVLQDIGFNKEINKDEKYEKIKNLLRNTRNNENLPDYVLEQLVVINTNRVGRLGKFIIIDDTDNKLYIFNEDYSLAHEIPVLTGKDKGDIDDFPFGVWLDENDLREKYELKDKELSRSIFEKYLRDREIANMQVTPSGVYTISKYTGKDQNDEFEKKFYGDGVLSIVPGYDTKLAKTITIALHGTHIEQREKNLDRALKILNDNPGSDVTFLSTTPTFGCINLKDEHLKLINSIFKSETANGNSLNVYIMNDNHEDIYQFGSGSFEEFISAYDYVNQLMHDKVEGLYSLMRKITGLNKVFINDEKYEIK